MARGIDGMKIFRSKKDYQTFLKIFSEILLSTKDSPVMAWALMPNHFHILIFIDKTPLATIMRKLLTKYAIYFNKQHKRKGHLFQNRYKSIICQDDLYLMQLVRYIHLNPIKARIIKSLKDLDQSDLTGHKALMGKSGHPWQNTKVILKYFSNNPSQYRKFIKEEASMMDGINLDGGGLFKTIAASGEDLESFQQSSEHEMEMFDDRILGRGDFVENVLDQLENEDNIFPSKKSLDVIIDYCLHKNKKTKEILRLRNATAKRIKKEIIHEAVIKHHYSASEVASAIGIHESNVSRLLKEAISETQQRKNASNVP